MDKLEIICTAVQEFHSVVKEMVADDEVTEAELVEDYGFTVRELEDALAEAHRIRQFA